MSIKELLPESDPLSMTLLMVPSRDRDSLLLLLSFLSRLLTNVEPRTDFFLMSLVGVFYDVLVDGTQGGNSPLFVAGLVRGYRQLIRAETSRASRSLKRAEGETRAGAAARRGSVSDITCPGNRSDSAEWKTVSHALKQQVDKLTQQERVYVIDLADRLSILVVPVDEFGKAASAAATSAAADANEGVFLAAVETCLKKILHALDLALKQASPLLPSFAWKALERVPGYFGQDAVSGRYAEAQMLKDFLTPPRREILRVLSLLSRVLLRESNRAGTESKLPLYRTHQTYEADVLGRHARQAGVEVFVCRRTLCRILAPAGFLPERVLGVMNSFACWSDATGEVKVGAGVSEGDEKSRGFGRLTKSISDFTGLHAEVGTSVVHSRGERKEG